MQALAKVAAGKGFLQLTERPRPEAASGEVVIEVAAAGICGTDLHIAEGEFPCSIPVVLGHEFSGRVVDVGANVTDFEVGARVVGEPHRGGCGACRHCRTGEVEMCGEKRAIGYRVDGCFAGYVALPASSLHRVPGNVTLEHAALAEPLAVVVKAVLERATVERGGFVVVLGCGPIGLLAAAVAKAAGARGVLLAGTDRDEALRLKVAREMGVADVINVEKEDLVAKVRDSTAGSGGDLIVEASGARHAIAQAFELVRKNGKICAIGLTGAPTVPVPWDTAIKKGAEVVCSFSSSRTSWERALALLAAGSVDAGKLITHTVPLTDWRTAFDLLTRLDAIKILLVP